MTTQYMEISYKGYTLGVTFDYYPPSKGSRERGTGLLLSPDEPASVEIEEITFNGQEIGGLLEDQTDDIETTILEQPMEEDGRYYE